MINSLHEFELAKAQIEHKEPIIVEFLSLQYTKLQMMEPYYNFFTKLCAVNKFEKLEMDTDSLWIQNLQYQRKQKEEAKSDEEQTVKEEQVLPLVILVNHVEIILHSFFPNDEVYINNQQIYNSNQL